MSAELPSVSRDGAPFFLRRFVFSAVICCIAAGPSLFIAWGDWDHAGIITGLLIFILFYTIAIGSDFACRLREYVLVQRTLWIGYAVRILISVLYPVGFIVDLVTGMVSVTLGEIVFGQVRANHPGDPRFHVTLVITLIHAVCANIVLGVFMLIVYGVQRAFVPERKRHLPGFCRHCDYDLRGSTHSAVCPECGSPTSEPAIGDPSRDPAIP